MALAKVKAAAELSQGVKGTRQGSPSVGAARCAFAEHPRRAVRAAHVPRSLRPHRARPQRHRHTCGSAARTPHATAARPRALPRALPHTLLHALP
eukprot:2886370-Prymnesium_polylepis.1